MLVGRGLLDVKWYTNLKGFSLCFQDLDRLYNKMKLSALSIGRNPCRGCIYFSPEVSSRFFLAVLISCPEMILATQTYSLSELTNYNKK